MSDPTARTPDSRRSIISTGTTTIVLIFVLLCLLTFSVLSLVSARANLRLSQKSADRTSAYYEAENLANDILIRVNECLVKNQDQEEETFLKNVRSELAESEEITFTDDRTLAWSVPLAENQYLKAEIRISSEPFSDGAYYEIISWNTYNDYDWGSDEPLPLLQSGAIPDMLTEE